LIESLIDSIDNTTVLVVSSMTAASWKISHNERVSELSDVCDAGGISAAVCHYQPGWRWWIGSRSWSVAPHISHFSVSLIGVQWLIIFAVFNFYTSVLFLVPCECL